MNVFQAIDAAFQQPAIQFLERTASGLCSALADPMRAALTLYVLWFGILVLRGAVQEPIPDALARIFKASIITTLTLSYASYNDYVGNFFFDTLPREIAAVVGFLAFADLATEFRKLPVRRPNRRLKALLLCRDPKHDGIDALIAFLGQRIFRHEQRRTGIARFRRHACPPALLVMR